MSVRLATLGTLLTALALSLALLWAALPAANGSSQPGPPPSATASDEFEEEAEEWPEEECESLEEWSEECEEPEEVGDASAPEECVLRSLSARVLAPRAADALRIVISYRAVEPANAYVSTRFSSARGSRSLGLVRRRLGLRGTIRLNERLPQARMELAREARSFTVTLDVPGVPGHCRDLLTLRLSHRSNMHGRGLWTQPAARRGR